MNTPCKFSCTNDEELTSYYPESDYWQTVHEQQSLYNSIANNQKKEQFIKSPLIIYNHCSVKGAVKTAYLLRQQLEEDAKKSAVYIRPILLFVVSPAWTNRLASLLELKQQFITGGIPEEEIVIKTRILDELTEINLFSECCKIRYMITSSNLTENWRCPFAYILVSMDERPVPADLTAVLNCLLPQPYSCAHAASLLNAGYVLTASSRFEQINTHIQLHLHDLNVHADQLRSKDNLINLLKQSSVFEILKGEVKYGFEGIFLHPDPAVSAIVEDIKRLVFDN